MSVARWDEAQRLAAEIDHTTLLMAAMVNAPDRRREQLRQAHPSMYAEVTARIGCEVCRAARCIPKRGCPHGP